MGETERQILAATIVAVADRTLRDLRTGELREIRVAHRCGRQLDETRTPQNAIYFGQRTPFAYPVLV
jgi:hypothetical protein